MCFLTHRLQSMKITTYLIVFFVIIPGRPLRKMQHCAQQCCTQSRKTPAGLTGRIYNYKHGGQHPFQRQRITRKFINTNRIDPCSPAPMENWRLSGLGDWPVPLPTHTILQYCGHPSWRVVSSNPHSESPERMHAIVAPPAITWLAR